MAKRCYIDIMRAIDILRKKRDGGELSEAELAAFVREATHRTDWEEYQLSALLMAIFFKGMTPHETATFTRLMTDSGKGGAGARTAQAASVAATGVIDASSKARRFRFVVTMRRSVKPRPRHGKRRRRCATDLGLARDRRLDVQIGYSRLGGRRARNP